VAKDFFFVEMENEFKELNEQLKIWNSEIDRMNKNIISFANLIRTVPTQIQIYDDALKTEDLVHQKALQLMDRMPIISYSSPAINASLLRFENPNSGAQLIIGNKYKITRILSGRFITHISYTRFSRDGKSVGFAGNSFFFAINIKTKTNIASWFAVSESAPNYVLDMDWDMEKAVLLMQDGLIRIVNYDVMAIVAEFPSFIENPTFVRILHSHAIFVGNDNGDVVTQSLSDVYETPKIATCVGTRPKDCNMDNEVIIVKTHETVYEISINGDTREVGPNTNDNLIDICSDNDKVILSHNEEKDEILIPGVNISTITISNTLENPFISVGTLEGCFFLWMISHNV
jgi:hypothetical protein